MRLLGVLSEAEKIVVLNASDIALNPVTSGSGSNLKLLEYIAYSIPVITTPFGLRGYALKHKEHLLVADVEAFSAVLKKEALSNMPALQAMAQRALAFASSRYNWSEIAGEGFEGSRVQGVEGRRRVQGFEGSRVRGFEGSRVQGVKGLRG
jgi:glycosyltransferase involved in cell wall biosynthesis